MRAAIIQRYIQKFTSTRPEGSREPAPVNIILALILSITYLQLDLGLGDVSLAAAATGNLLSLSNLIPDSLSSSQ